MSRKILRKYNKETHEWELVSAPDISIDARLPEGAEITDNNVRITNENYSSDTTLNDVLETINDDISRLQRNVSWLDSHKGEGGGGGGGGSTYKISVTSPVIENGSVFVKQNTLNVEFMITGPAIDEECTYSYIFNGVESTTATISTNTPIVIRNIQLPDSTDFSTFTIKAKSPYGINIAPVSFNIYKTNIELKFDRVRAGDKYDNGVFKVKTGQQNAIIPLLLVNGIQNAYVTIGVTANTGDEYSMESRESVGTIEKDFDFWNLINKGEVQVGTYYLLKFGATATLDTHVAVSEEFYLRITIIDSDNLSITAGINGYDAGADEVVVQPESLMRYNFRTYAPKEVKNVYYAAKLENKTRETSVLILGEYFDENLHNVGATAYTANSVVAVGETKTSQYYISENAFSEGNLASLYIKIWDENGTSAVLEQKIQIGEIDSAIFPKQIPSRLAGTNNKDTLFLSWNKINAVEVNKYQWISYTDNYSYLSSKMASDFGTTATAAINVFDANISSGIISHGGLPYLRCQNHAYGICDISIYGGDLGEIVALTDNRSDNNFCISVTLEIDETANENDTAFLWGINNANGELTSGIKITAGMVYWVIDTDSLTKEQLKCRMTAGKKKTVDFSFERTAYGATAKIYIDGVVNCAVEFNNFGEYYSFPEYIYVGADFINSEITNFCSCKIYDISIFSKELNETQIVSNAKNAKIDASIPEEIEEYKVWKEKNFISPSSTDETVPESLFLKGGKYTSGFSYNEANNIAQKSNIPSIILTFDSNSNFNKIDFFTKKEKSDTEVKYLGICEYYDPATNITVRFNIWVEYQGTTTLTYRVKNLEIGVADEVTIDGITVPKLFQPKKTWFPEKQFTLKADVVDSAHANNAVLGEWINNCNMLSPNPAMAAFNSSTRPKDVDDSGNKVWHDYEGESIDYNEDVTIKHTLEGFPVLLFIKFSDSSDYTFIGIYSFNLGRYSYFNMGMQFLDSFSRRDTNGDITCPKIINYYKTKPSLGTSVNSSECYSFEFGNEGNHSVPEHPVWSQYDPSIIKTYGEFKYPTDVSPEMPIWTKLCELFRLAAQSPAENYYGEPITVFKVKNGDVYENLHYYVVNNAGMYVDTGRIIDVNASNAEQLANHLNINNAAVYFIIANAFGMTDSLGKNMVLRTWDNGETWWICFYDMDTALGLSNKGMEDVPVTASIDEITMENVGQETRLKTIYHSVNSKFAAASSKLWGLLRDTSVLYTINSQHYFYETIWNTLRKNGGQLSYAENFIKLMEERIKTCGEIVYNCDYYQKYIILDNADLDSAIGFLHGTRIDFVRDWLKKHFSYLDGAFDVNFANGDYTFSDTDSTYNNGDNTASINFRQVGGEVIPFTLRAKTPSFVAFNIDQDLSWNKFYIPEAGVDTLVYIRNSTSASSVLLVKGAVSLTKLEGLRGNFMGFGNNSGSPLRSLASFDVSGSQELQQGAPFNSAYFTYNGESPLETINFSNTGNRTIALDNYVLDLYSLKNLLSVNISNSQVTSLVLPNTSLKFLKFNNSKLAAIQISEQNRLTELDFSGCNKMETIQISDCSVLTSVTISDLNLLSTITINRCNALSSITIQSCSSLSSITITDNSNLEILNISELLTNSGLTIKILGGKLSEVSIVETNCTKITLPSEANLSYLKTLDLSNNIYLERIAIGNEEPEYLDEPLFDFSRMPSLRSFSLRNVYKVKYLRLQNIENAPFELSEDSLYGCTGIERILGHFRVTKSSMFNGLVNFRINDWDKPYEEYTASEWQGIWNSSIFDFNSGNTATNITFGEPTATTINLQLCFANTLCDVLDVIYVFKRLNAKITNINSIFRNCGAILTVFEKSLPTELFSNCTGVKSAFGVFYGCDGINTEISSQMLAPIMGQSGITEFDSVFAGTNVYVKYNEVLFPSGNAITFINNFNPVYYYDVIDEKPQPFDVNPLNVLSNLTSLIRISNSFDNIIFSGDGAGDEFKLFYGITNLKTIYNSFNHFVCEVYNSSGACVKNILGKATNDYPQLTIVTGSFNVDSENQSVSIYIGNTFFGNSNATLQNFSSNFDEVYKYIDFNDCGGFTFPYKILKGCVNLEKCGGLFKEVECLYNNTVNTGITLPNYVDESGNTISMFEDCVALKEIPAFFSGMTNVNYTLSGNGFKNCQLEDVSNIFDNTGYKALKSGIPLKMFYQCDKDGCVRNTIKNMSSAFRGCNSSECTCYTFDGLDSDLYENYRDENNVLKLRWNIYAFDGTRDFCTREFNTSGGTKVTLADIEAAHPELGSIPAEFSQGYVSGTQFEYIQNKDDLGYEYTIDEINEIFTIDNYFCPPDIFKYCANDGNTAIDGVFYDTSSVIGGLHGKIPEFLFRPITNIMSLSQVFYGCTLLLPYEWGGKNSETEEITYGKRYPSELFSGLSNLRDLSRTFMSNKIYGKTEINLSEIPATINSLSGVFERTDFVENSRVVGDLYRLKSLLDISAFFAFSNVSDIPLSPFITPPQNPSISQCSGFMRNCQGITNIGMVPEIWNYNYSNTSQYTAAFYGVNQTLRASLEEIARTTGNRYIERMLRLD